ncbi:hypothetical protein ABES25_16120 [Bacillus gobiensis]
MDIKIHSDFSNANLDEMKGIYRAVGWIKHTNETIKARYLNPELANEYLE